MSGACEFLTAGSRTRTGPCSSTLEVWASFVASWHADRLLQSKAETFSARLRGPLALPQSLADPSLSEEVRRSILQYPTAGWRNGYSLVVGRVDESVRRLEESVVEGMRGRARSSAPGRAG